MVDNKDNTFFDRIRSSIATVEAWDADPSLLAECRLMIPFDRLIQGEGDNDEACPYIRDDDYLYFGNALFLKRLALFFQKDVMTWVNTPPCKSGTCDGDGGVDTMLHKESRAPHTEEEREGRADRVEVYQCKSCASVSTFPRYNSVRKLLETRMGRCGEYANLFGLYCRAAGFETRYVMDWTDHVWVEALVGEEWIMADSCEGIINKPSMYESGWGKKLNYVVGISVDSVVDLTPRYTRKIHDKEFQDRRRYVTSTEAEGERIIAQVNASLQQGIPAPRVQLLAQRASRELAELQQCKTTTEWTEEEKHGRGRISGSLEWKIARQEEGVNMKEEAIPYMSRGLLVERFLPTGELHVNVIPRNEAGIIVSGADCDVGQPGCISAVVIDVAHLGCVLQCRSFASWSNVAEFLHSVPTHRIVVLKGRIVEEEIDEVTTEKLQILGGFSLSRKSSDGIMFVGQIEAHPKWATCRSYSDSTGISLAFPRRESPRKLKKEKNCVPSRVSHRLDESVMPLRDQCLASDAHKEAVFISYALSRPWCVGYTTKDGCPIYIMENASFPFRRGDEWNTFHFLPAELVHNEVERERILFNIPVDENFFTSLLGPFLLQRPGNPPTAVVEAINNNRLVGLYFSAHWCPPCRRFTPMLIEAYNYLKEEYPFHGLEIVFVSSDRSEAEFNQYYASMPWAAVPYEATMARQRHISQRFGIQGIPGLVILDSMSGQIVASADQSRREVVQASQRGDEGIEAMLTSWSDRIPEDSEELIRMLELSCEEDEGIVVHESFSDPYLVRAQPWKPPARLSPAERIKETFSKLVADGEAPNAAAAKAIKIVSQAPSISTPSFEEGGLSAVVDANFGPPSKGIRTQELIAQIKATNPYSDDIIQLLLRLISTFLENAAREPWNPRFRSMKLSNKTVDRTTRVKGTLEFICLMGMSVVPTCLDFVVIIPLAADLDLLRSDVSKALAEATG